MLSVRNYKHRTRTGAIPVTALKGTDLQRSRFVCVPLVTMPSILRTRLLSLGSFCFLLRAISSCQGTVGRPVFCVSVDAKADDYIRRIFGPHGYLVIDNLEQLPQRLPELYLRLTA